MIATLLPGDAVPPAQRRASCCSYALGTLGAFGCLAVQAHALQGGVPHMIMELPPTSRRAEEILRTC